MKPTTTKNAYWIATILFTILMLLDGYGGVSQQAAGQEVMKHLGYPLYILYIFGVAKILGAISIVQTKYKTIKEWAFAGFAFSFLGGAASRALVGDPVMETLFPLIALGIMFIPYFLWKKVEKIKTIA